VIGIVGVGETDYTFADPRPPAAMAADAIRRAVEDAGLEVADVDGFVTEAHSMPLTAPADQLAQRLGVRDRKFTAHLSLAGAGNVGAPLLARHAIDSGVADVVVVYYALNLSAKGAGGAYSYHARDRAKVSFEMPMGLYSQPAYFALAAARYRAMYGLSPEDLGSIAISTRQHASRTPNALRRTPISMEEYLEQPYIAEPLNRLDCCLVNDGAVAYVMTSIERARDLRRPPVAVAGVGIGAKPVTEAQYFGQSEDITTTPAAISAPRAFADAGLSLGDVDVAEIYDCFTISVLLQLEDLGFAPKGEGTQFVRDNGLDLGSSCPVNTHGGLLSQSYTVAANHVVEAVRQLRGERGEGQVEGAEVALVAGLGVPEHATLLLTVDR
jgi:acetyl-CoA acetyltransferase